MAKVKYIKLSDAVELLREAQHARETEYHQISAEPDIYADAYGAAAYMLEQLPTVEMEETEREKS